MTKTKPKTFSTLEEVIETYFPKSVAEDSPDEDGATVGLEVASALAKEFQDGLRVNNLTARRVRSRGQ